MLNIISRPTETQPPPVDFEEIQSTADIPLERHGCLLLLAARYATTSLFGSGQPVVETPVFPDLANIFFNFIGKPELPEGGTFSEPDALADSLLTLVVLSLDRPVEKPDNDQQFEEFVLSLVACSRTSRLRIYNSIDRLPSTVFHSHPSSQSRFKFIRKVLESDGDLGFAREKAVGWLKGEILSAINPKDDSSSSVKDKKNVFADPHYFAVLFPLIFNTSDLLLDTATASPSSLSPLTFSWLDFTQTRAPYHLATLNFYYLLVQSTSLRTRLELQKLYHQFTDRYITPLRALCGSFIDDLASRGGDGVIASEVGEEAANAGMFFVEITIHTIEKIENAAEDMFLESGDEESPLQSEKDHAEIEAIRKGTAP